MQKIAVMLVWLLIAACWQDSQSGPVFEARTTLVHDGDSFMVKRGRAELEIRLYGIDAPERGQAWSDEAHKALRQLIEGETLRVEPVERDRYDRIVARIFRASDDLYVNAEMIGQGHAWVYRRYTEENALLRRERSARKSETGLWQLPRRQRVPPWEWREENKP